MLNGKTRTSASPQHHHASKHQDQPMVSQIAKLANEIWVKKGKPSGKYSRSWNEAKLQLIAQPAK